MTDTNRQDFPNTLFCTDITVLTGIEAVRKRPLMYIGGKSTRSMADRLVIAAILELTHLPLVNYVKVVLSPELGSGAITVYTEEPMDPEKLKVQFTTLQGASSEDRPIAVFCLLALSRRFKLRVATVQGGYTHTTESWSFVKGIESPKKEDLYCTQSMSPNSVQIKFDLDHTVLPNIELSHFNRKLRAAIEAEDYKRAAIPFQVSFTSKSWTSFSRSCRP